MVAQMVVAVTHEIGNPFILTKPVFHSILSTKQCWLVISTLLKCISQNWNLPQIGVKIKNIWNYHPEFHPIQSHINAPVAFFWPPGLRRSQCVWSGKLLGKRHVSKVGVGYWRVGVMRNFLTCIIYIKWTHQKQNWTFLYKNIPGTFFI